MIERVSDVAVLAERLHGASDAARHELLLEAASRPDTTRQAEEACALLVAAGTAWARGQQGVDDERLALSIAAGRVPRHALDDPSAVVWLLACLSPDVEGALDGPSTGAASALTRERLAALARPAQRRHSRRGPFLMALTLAAAATLAAFAYFGPASDEWARSLGLSRGRMWRLDPAIAAAAERAATTGELSAALFHDTAGDPRRERTVDPSGTAPVPLHPRWEAVRDTRPEFRFTAAGEAAGFEVFVVDANRNLVWSAVADSSGRLAYPEAAAPLEPGAVYYWKVNRTGGTRLAASRYVALQVLEDSGSQALERELASAGGHPFLEGVAYDRHGLYTAALDAFDRAAAEGYAAAAGSRAAVRVKQGLP